MIGRLTTESRPHIVSNSWRFDTTADWKMLGDDPDKWPVTSIADDARKQPRISSSYNHTPHDESLGEF